MSRAWRKLNRKVQIDQRRYYLGMIAVLIGIPVNFIFSGWGEDELAGTFAHFSPTWFMWVEYKNLSLHPPTPKTPSLHPFYRQHIHASAHTHTHSCKLHPLRCILARQLWLVKVVCGWVAVLCTRARIFGQFCVCTRASTIAAGAISGNESTGRRRRGVGISLLRLVYILNT